MKNTVAGKLVFASTWGRGVWWSTPPVPPRRTRWYVDMDATGLNTGANWVNAFTQFQTALDTVLSGDSIWVAEGIYLPQSEDGFHLDYDNIRIWGGFDGTEDSVSQRDFALNATILSGDIGVQDDSLDNARHVFVFGGHNGNVSLDGFVITEGYARGAGHQNGGGIFFKTDLQTGKPVIMNCRIHNNSSTGDGAGMYLADHATGDAEMYIVNCVFENNRSATLGGGLHVDTYEFGVPADTGTAVVHLNKCTFSGNTAHSAGGGMYLEAIRSASVKLFVDSTIFDGNSLTSFQGTGAAISGNTYPEGGSIELNCQNSMFVNHSANVSGGAIYLDLEEGSTQSVFDNCTFTNNDAGEGGAIYNYCRGPISTSSLEFDDCTFESNSSASGGAILLNSTSLGTTEVSFTACTFDGNFSSGRGGAIHYNGDNTRMIESVIDSCTFTGNTANDAGAIRYYIRNLSGSDTTGIANLTILNSLFENNIATTAAPGGAIAFISEFGHVTVAVAGTDFISNSTETYGGAVANIHITNASSHLNAEFIDCDFTGNSVEMSGPAGGGAVYNLRTDATFSECLFSHNSGRVGGAVFNSTWNKDTSYIQSFTDCDFMSNHAAEHGGAIYNLHDESSTMLFSLNECTLDSNYTDSVITGRGGAIYTTGTGRSVETISGCQFLNNQTALEGGAMYISNSLSLSDTVFVYVDDCTFTNNDAVSGSNSIEQYGPGAGARIFSQWNNTEFHHDTPALLFRNRKTGGISSAVFLDCSFYVPGGGAQQFSQPSLTEPVVIENQ